jgi:hypothetical protein
MNNKLRGGIFCELEKTLDCFNHDILLFKLKFYGISDKDLQLYQSYPCNRYCKQQYIMTARIVMNFMFVPLFNDIKTLYYPTDAQIIYLCLCWIIKCFNNNKVSNCAKVRHGVPQSSILRPLLFLLYINDLPKVINKTSAPIIFADDTRILFTHFNSIDFNKNIHIVFTTLNKRLRENQLSVNFNKKQITYTLQLREICQLT